MCKVESHSASSDILHEVFAPRIRHCDQDNSITSHLLFRAVCFVCLGDWEEEKYSNAGLRDHLQQLWIHTEHIVCLVERVVMQTQLAVRESWHTGQESMCCPGDSTRMYSRHARTLRWRGTQSKMTQSAKATTHMMSCVSVECK